MAKETESAKDLLAVQRERLHPLFRHIPLELVDKSVYVTQIAAGAGEKYRLIGHGSGGIAVHEPMRGIVTKINYGTLASQVQASTLIDALDPSKSIDSYDRDFFIARFHDGRMRYNDEENIRALLGHTVASQLLPRYFVPITGILIADNHFLGVQTPFIEGACSNSASLPRPLRAQFDGLMEEFEDRLDVRLDDDQMSSNCIATPDGQLKIIDIGFSRFHHLYEAALEYWDAGL